MISTLWLLTLNISAFAEVKIGVVNFSKVLQESPQKQKADTEFKNKFKKQREELTKSHQQFQKDIENFRKNSPTMKQEEKSKQEQQLQKQQQKLQEMQSKYQREAEETQQKLLNEVLKNIEKVVNKTAETKKLDIVIDKSGTLYSKPSFDITDELIKQLKAQK